MIFPVKKMTFDAKLSYDYAMSYSPQSIEVSATLLSQMMLYLSSLKVDTDAFLRSLGVDPQLLKSPDTRISVETYLHIQESAAEYTQDPCFGLHMGEYAEPGSWSILGYMMMNSKNLGEAFERSARYSRIVGNMIEGRVEPHLNRVKAIFFTPDNVPLMSRHCFESTFSSTVHMMRSLTGRNISPLEVTFIYPEPSSRSEYERLFQCPVLFAQKENSMSFSWQMLTTPILMANQELLDYFENYARNFLSKMEHQKETTQTVTRIILAHLSDDSLTITRVAREMAVSVRTLQNRLENEGVIFSELLKEIREKLAKKYLHENYSVEQITYLLGFSEPSVFRKAFKRWSGFTPRQYRERSYAIAK